MTEDKEQQLAIKKKQKKTEESKGKPADQNNGQSQKTPKAPKADVEMSD